MASPEAAARTIFEAIAKRDLDSAFDLVAEDAVDDFVAIGEFCGRREVRRFFDEMLTAFPDFDVTVERIVGDARTAAVQWQVVGTFSGGPFHGIEPTGRHVVVRGVDVMEFEDGRVRHNTIYYDGASFARQVGLLPREGSAPDKAMLSAFNALTRARQHLRDRAARRRDDRVGTGT